MTTKVLFVCLGNICRSPAAEGVFLKLLRKRAVFGKFKVDSAGTSGHHIGELADSRMISHSSKRGVNLVSRSRKFQRKDFRDFDYIVTMDHSNFDTIISKASSDLEASKVLKMTDFCEKSQAAEVPDPYYGGENGFEEVLDILEDACEGLFKRIMNGK